MVDHLISVVKNRVSRNRAKHKVDSRRQLQPVGVAIGFFMAAPGRTDIGTIICSSVAEFHDYQRDGGENDLDMKLSHGYEDGSTDGLSRAVNISQFR